MGWGSYYLSGWGSQERPLRGGALIQYVAGHLESWLKALQAEGIAHAKVQR